MGLDHAQRNTLTAPNLLTQKNPPQNDTSLTKDALYS
jgi:hypothetical protein